MARKKLKFWSIPVTELLDQCVEKAVEVNAHVSKSDFVRDAVREKLAKMGLLPGEETRKEDRVGAV
jgi:Arc/MetJ-type ribon-helix-helix transcriptional regulator